MANGAKAFETGTRSALTEFLSQIAPKMLQDTLQYDRQQELFERELEEKKRVSNEENDKFMLGQFMKISNIDQRKAAINAYNPSSELGEKQLIAFKDVVGTTANRLADANAFLKGYQNMIGSGAENFVYKGVTYNRDSGLDELEVRLGNSVEPQIKGMYQNYLTSTNIKNKTTNQNLAQLFASFLPEESKAAVTQLSNSNINTDDFTKSVGFVINASESSKTASLNFYNTEQGQDFLRTLTPEQRNNLYKDLDLVDDSVVSDDGGTRKDTSTFFGKRDGTTTNLNQFSFIKSYFSEKNQPFNEKNLIEFANIITKSDKEESMMDNNIDEATYDALLKEANAFLQLDEDVEQKISGVDVGLTGGKGIGLSFEARNPDEQITGLEFQPGRGGMPGIGLKTVNKQVQSFENALSKLNVDLNISGKKGKAGNTISISNNPVEQRGVILNLKQALNEGVRMNKLKNQNETLIANKVIPLLIQTIEEEARKEQPQEIEVNILELIKQANIQ
jgi:hypothetical protein